MYPIHSYELQNCIHHLNVRIAQARPSTALRYYVFQIKQANKKFYQEHKAFKILSVIQYGQVR